MKKIIISLTFCISSVFGFSQYYAYENGHASFAVQGSYASNYGIGFRIDFEKKIKSSNAFYLLGLGYNNTKLSTPKYDYNTHNNTLISNIGFDFYDIFNLKKINIKGSAGLLVSALIQDFNLKDNSFYSLNEYKTKYIYGVNGMISIDYILTNRIFIRLSTITYINLNWLDNTLIVNGNAGVVINLN